MTSAHRTAWLASVMIVTANLAHAVVPPSLAPSGQLSDVRAVCGDEIRTSRMLGNKNDVDFDTDLTQLHDSLRAPPKPGKNGQDGGIRAEPKSFSHDEAGAASYLA